MLTAALVSKEGRNRASKRHQTCTFSHAWSTRAGSRIGFGRNASRVGRERIVTDLRALLVSPQEKQNDQDNERKSSSSTYNASSDGACWCSFVVVVSVVA